MATNPYFKKFGTKNEINLQEDLMIEFIKQKGIDVYYMPKVYLAEDQIMNEVVNHYHSKGIMIEMLLRSYDDWENNSIDIGSFGLTQIPNEVIFVVSKRRFEETVKEQKLSFGVRPNEGDIIYSPDIQEMFQIKKVNKDKPTKSKDRWILKCDKYDDNNEINIDFTNNIEQAGTFDPHYDNGKSEYIPINSEIEEFLSSFEDEECVEIDPELSAEENDSINKKQELENTINKKKPNQYLEAIAEDILNDD